jgi:hypothetical protein
LDANHFDFFGLEGIMKVKTGVKGGGMKTNTTETAGLKLKTGVKGGGVRINRSETAGLKVKTNVKGGGLPTGGLALNRCETVSK